MDEAASQGGELVIGIMAALAVMGIVLLLTGPTDAGLLRICVTRILESAC